MPQLERILSPAFAFVAALSLPCASGADDAVRVTIDLGNARFDCDTPLIPDKGFERCEVRAVARFTAPPRALLKVFGHCEVTIRYKTRDGLMENRDLLHGQFDGAIADGTGSAPITIIFKPIRFSFDPIVRAKATDLRCSIDQAFNY